jgi:ABC-type transport system involved in Fe-S cluster assembly fused permease/ATPase subunit
MPTIFQVAIRSAAFFCDVSLAIEMRRVLLKEYFQECCPHRKLKLLGGKNPCDDLILELIYRFFLPKIQLLGSAYYYIEYLFEHHLSPFT